MSQVEDVVESPRKRLKLEQPGTELDIQKALGQLLKRAQRDLKANGEVQADSPLAPAAEKEQDVGISVFVNESLVRLSATFKHRYTDFLVNEVQLSGEVLHLRTVPDCMKTKSASVNETNMALNDTPKSQASTSSSSKPATTQNGDRQEAGDTTIAQKTERVDDSTAELSIESREALTKLSDAETATKLIELYAIATSTNDKPEIHNEVICPKMDDKDARTQLHKGIREFLHGRLLSYWSDEHEAIVVKVGPKPRAGTTDGRGQKRGRGEYERALQRKPARFAKPSGEYVHFTLFKVNKTDEDVLGFISRAIRNRGRPFQTAGKKDRRAVTVQRISGHRVTEAQLHEVAKQARNWVIGDFKYENNALRTGDQAGNEFTIILRDVQIDDSVLAKWAQGADERATLIRLALQNAARSLLQSGFLNYFGLQRFGTHEVKTHTVGMHLLNGDHRSAVDAILSYHPDELVAATDTDFGEANKISGDIARRAQAIHLFKTGSRQEGLSKMTRSGSAEYAVMSHLSRTNGSEDYRGAIQAISHQTRTLYGHAYQSLMFNLAASYRWSKLPRKVLAGDMILTNEEDYKRYRMMNSSAASSAPQQVEEVDADGEIVILPSSEDRVAQKQASFRRARPLTAEEANSGRYSIFDIVLPLPGWDVEYPENMRAFYTETMAQTQHGGVDAAAKNHAWRQAGLPGDYRKLLSRPIDGSIDLEVKEYTDELEQFVLTDTQEIEKTEGVLIRASGIHGGATASTSSNSNGDASADKRVAAILKFRLGPGGFATMLLREMFEGGLADFKKEYSGGRRD